jgi:hypothetical protein
MSKNNQSKTVDIPIQIHASDLASLLSEKAIIKNNIINKIHKANIPRQNFCCSLFVKLKYIKINHLNKAHIANAQIVKVHINLDHENTSKNHNNITKDERIIKSQRYFSLSVNHLIIADIPENIREIPKIISKNFQKTLGAQIVIIPHIMVTKPREATNQTGHFFCSELVVTLMSAI